MIYWSIMKAEHEVMVVLIRKELQVRRLVISFQDFIRGSRNPCLGKFPLGIVVWVLNPNAVKEIRHLTDDQRRAVWNWNRNRRLEAQKLSIGCK